MAGHLPLPPAQFKPVPWAKVAIIAAQWHQSLIETMVSSTHELLLQQLRIKSDNLSIHYLPGSYELPFAAQLLFKQRPDLDAIIAFGIILKGDTTHDASVVQSVVNGFSNVTARFDKPIINEVIGVTDIKHAEARAQSKGQEAAFALSELLSWQKNL